MFNMGRSPFMGLCFVQAYFILSCLFILRFLWRRFATSSTQSHKLWAFSSWSFSPTMVWATIISSSIVVSFSFSFLVLYFFLAVPWVSPQPMCWATIHPRSFAFNYSPPPNTLEKFALNFKSPLWYHLSHMVTPWCCSIVTPFRYCASLQTYVTCTWKTMHLVKLQHLGLPRSLGLTLTSRWVGLIPIVDFPSGPRCCHPWLPSPLLQPNHKLCLVQGLSVSRPTS